MKNLLLILVLTISVLGYSQESPKPIIDIHLHCYNAIPPNLKASWAAPHAKELTSPVNAKKHLEQVMAEMEKNNIKLGIISSETLAGLEMVANTNSELFMTGVQTNTSGRPIVSPDSLKILFENGKVDMLGELGLQYFGLAPDDPMMAPYYAIAEENNIPVCLHTGLGPPGGPHSFAPEFRTTLGKPTLFEPVLVKHPKLKAFLAHAGWPYISETKAMMYIYPELYVDIGVLCWALPKEAFYSTLKELMDAGFGKRILFGSDQMIWPEAISMAINTVKEAEFLSEEELRDILYNNAVRFLELTPEEMAKHHK